VPMEGFSLAELGDIAREAERLGYTDAWSFEVDGVDGFTPLAAIGTATTGMRLGIAIANVYTRGPATLASTAAGLADVAPGRFVLGIGAGSQPIVESWNGGTFSRPAARVRETAQFLRAALAGERVVFKGETFSVDGFRLTKVPAQPVPIHIAALREGMLKVAGQVGDGVILNWLSPDDVPRSVAVVREAAKRAGRDPEARRGHTRARRIRAHTCDGDPRPVERARCHTSRPSARRAAATGDGVPDAGLGVAPYTAWREHRARAGPGRWESWRRWP